MINVSVIIPLYNKEKDIAKAIGSVLNQSYSSFELIIVNDGSTDRSEQVAKQFIDPRIRFFIKENGGVSSARNFGIREASFDLIAFLDGDDWWAPDFLETLVNLQIKYRDAGIYAGQYVQVNKRNELISLDRFPKISEGYFDFFSHVFAVCSSSVLVKKAVFNVCGFFDENLTHGEDTDMWVRIAMKFKVCYTEKVISFYNIAGNPLTRSVGKIPELKKHIISKLDQYKMPDNDIWNNKLTIKKGKYLENLYRIKPWDKEVREMIFSLPDYYFVECPNSILKKNPKKILLENFFFFYPRLILSRCFHFIKCYF